MLHANATVKAAVIITTMIMRKKFQTYPALISTTKLYQKKNCKYVTGATGPTTFDCSGLVMWAHSQCGISVPRTSKEQANAGREGDGSIGDVVAFGNPVYHVGICDGNGNFVHAPEPNDVVKVTALKYMTKTRRFRRFY